MIAVLGADGLLGSWLCYRFKGEAFGFHRSELDIRDYEYTHEVLKALNPDAVINCAGITNKRNVNPEYRMEVNGIAPHKLATICDELGIKLVHVSTDCVFSGEHGTYTELDIPDADDNYGWTKAQGEVHRSPHVTVRASFVGWPDPKGRGLLSWLKSADSPVEGYENVRWNGFTAPALASYLLELAYDYTTGVVHAYNREVISKYDLLCMFKDVYDLSVEIIPVEEPVINKTLSSIRNKPLECTISMYDQLVWMRSHQNSYKSWLNSQTY